MAASAREFFKGKTDDQLEKLWIKWNDIDPATLAKSRIENSVGGDTVRHKVDYTSADMFQALRQEIESRPNLAEKLGLRRVQRVAVILN